MSDLERLTNEAAAKAALSVGKDAAKQAVNRLLDGDTPPSEPKKAPSSRKWKVIALAVLGLCLFLGLVGMVLNYWVWFFGAGVVGLAGVYGYWKLRKRLAQPKAAVAESREAPQARLRVASPAEEPKLAEPSPEQRRAEAQARARALAEAKAQQEQQVEDGLAALKARMKK